MGSDDEKGENGSGDGAAEGPGKSSVDHIFQAKTSPKRTEGKSPEAPQKKEAED